MIVLDTSFLVSFFLNGDSNHAKALELALKNKDEDMLLSDIILYETLTVINYKGGIELAKEAHGQLERNRQIHSFRFTDVEADEIVSMFFAQKKRKLSFADVSVLYLANKSSAKILSFDEELLK